MVQLRYIRKGVCFPTLETNKIERHVQHTACD